MTRLKRYWSKFVKFLKDCNPTPPDRVNSLMDKIKSEGKVYSTMIQPSKPWPRASGYEPEQPTNVPDMPCPPPPPVPKKPEPCHMVDYGPLTKGIPLKTPAPMLTIKGPIPKLLTRIPKDMFIDFQDLLKYISSLNHNWKEVNVGRFTAKNNDDCVDITIDDI